MSAILLGSAAGAGFEDVRCEGVYPKHLQGIATDDRETIFWCFTDVLVKTDRRGHVLNKIPVAKHHGDLCYVDGKLYVAVNLGPFNDPQGRADSWVYEYDAAGLCETARHKLPELIYGAGGIACRAGRFIVIGGLPVGADDNYAYEYDPQFHFVARHTIRSGYTRMGIQTAAYGHGSWWFGCYGKPEVLLKTDEQFNRVERFTFNCSWGIACLADGSFLVARGKWKLGVGCTASVVVADADAKLGLVVRSAKGGAEWTIPSQPRSASADNRPTPAERTGKYTGGRSGSGGSP